MFKAVFEYSALLLQRQASSLSSAAASHPVAQQVCRLAHRNKQSLCAAYSDDNMTLLESQTVYASLGNNSKSRLAVTDASMGRAENAMGVKVHQV